MEEIVEQITFAHWSLPCITDKRKFFHDEMPQPTLEKDTLVQLNGYDYNIKYIAKEHEIDSQLVYQQKVMAHVLLEDFPLAIIFDCNTKDCEEGNYMVEALKTLETIEYQCP